MTTKRKDRPEENVETRTERPRRSFVDDVSDILSVHNKDPDYEYRWVNDVAGRVNRMIQAGYDVVTDGMDIGVRGSDSGAPNTITVDRARNIKAVLMRLRKTYADQDRLDRSNAIAKTEAAFFRSEKEADGRYGEAGYEE